MIQKTNNVDIVLLLLRYYFASMSASIHETLKLSKKEIRLCRIEPNNDFSSPVSCHLYRAELPTIDKYATISYVWGNSLDTEIIFINGFEYHARVNLVAGLRRYREKFGAEQATIWADSICIDLQNTAEQIVQIGLMRDIFSQCQFAFAWLGEADGDSDHALEALEDMNKAVVMAQVSMDLLGLNDQWKSTQSYVCWPSIHRFVQKVDHPRTWAAIERLLNRSFWSRVWIFQEMVLSPDIRFCCGSKVVEYYDFQAVFDMEFFYKHRMMSCAGPNANYDDDGGLFKAIYASKRLTTLRDLRWERWTALKASEDWSPQLSIVGILINLGHLKATDPRDMVHGLLSVSKNDIVSSYQKSACQLYTELAQDAIQSTGDLEILTFSGIGILSCAKEHVGAPSWVPDWVARSTFFFITHPLLEIKDAPPGTVARYREVCGSSVLIVRGVICEEVVKVESPSFWTAWSDRNQYAKDICSRPHPSGSHPLSAFFKSLTHQIPPTVSYGGFIWESDDPYNKPTPPKEAAITEIWSLPKPVTSINFAAGFLFSLKPHDEWVCSREHSWSPDFWSAFGQLHPKYGTCWPEPSELIHEFTDILDVSLDRMPTPESRIATMGRDHLFAYLTSEETKLQNTRFFHTTSGYFGTGHEGVEVGDLLCALWGFPQPVILRKVNDHYVFVGVCCVPGYNNAEAFQKVEEGESAMEEIEIW